MSYDDLCKKLGIDRAAITKAVEEPKNQSVKVGKEGSLWRVPMGKRVQTNRVDEDMSHLVTPLARKISNKLKAKPRRAKK